MAHIPQASTAVADGTSFVPGRLGWRRWSCWLWGHHVDNHRFRTAEPGARQCRCGEGYLPEDGGVTRVRHTLSCFLRHHTYQRLTDRHGYHEYVCVFCGHPLLFRADRDPYDRAALFTKKVRYLCGLFGHHVERVASRNGFTEFGCHCGHTFLKRDDAAEVIRHPLICVARAHRIRFVERRSGFAEYVCVDCGHPFCFAQSDAAVR